MTVESSSRTSKHNGLSEEPVVDHPKDDSVRGQREGDHSQKSDAPKVKPTDQNIMALGTSQKKTKFLGQFILIVITATVVMMGVNEYRDVLQKKRNEIINIIKRKGFDLDDPEVRATYRETTTTSWLPVLNKLLESLRGVPRKPTETFLENPEKGSYIDYIQRNSKPFDEREAVEWEMRSMRKPAGQ